MAFRGVRPSVRVFAEAEGEQKQQRAPRKEKVITVQLEDVKEGDEFEGTVVSRLVRSQQQELLCGVLVCVWHAVARGFIMHGSSCPHVRSGTCLQASVEDYGAFVEFGARVAGMIHISKLGVSQVRDSVAGGTAAGSSCWCFQRRHTCAVHELWTGKIEGSPIHPAGQTGHGHPPQNAEQRDCCVY